MGNKPVKKRIKMLVDALRSGKYEQTKGTLRSGNKYCCLGVACDVFRKETGKGRWKPNKGDFGTVFFGKNFVLNHTASEGFLPLEVSKWFGFATEDPALAYNLTATRANDEENYDFAAIADAFEKRFLKKTTNKK